MPVTKIISGGQTGADQGALRAAKDLGLGTGGTAPKGYRTDECRDLSLSTVFGLTEHTSGRYPPRTDLNVRDSDGTLLFGNIKSAGGRLTMRICIDRKKPAMIIDWAGGAYKTSRAFERDKFLLWLRFYGIQTLNVAGNRESRNTGIGEAVRDFLNYALKEQAP